MVLESRRSFHGPEYYTRITVRVIGAVGHYEVVDVGGAAGAALDSSSDNFLL